MQQCNLSGVVVSRDPRGRSNSIDYWKMDSNSFERKEWTSGIRGDCTYAEDHSFRIHLVVY